MVVPNDAPPRTSDPWSTPTFLLWVLFLVFGVLFEPLFFILREAAGVTTKTAFVNNPQVVIIAMAVYVARFSLLRSRETQPHAPAFDRGSQTVFIGVVTFVAFFWLPIEAVGKLGDAIFPSRTWLYYVYGGVVAAIIIKLICWIYLLSLFFRYYVLDNERVFVHIFGIIPKPKEPPVPPVDAQADLDPVSPDWTPANVRKETAD